MREKLLIESEEKMIDGIYTKQKEVCTKLQNIANNSMTYRIFGKLPKRKIMKTGKGIEDLVKKIECDGYAFNSVASSSIDYYKNIWESEADLIKGHLRYLPMKSQIDETEFRNFLCSPHTNIQLKENDKDELCEIFRKVKERAENMEIPDECKVELTPWEFFKNHFYLWGGGRAKMLLPITYTYSIWRGLVKNPSEGDSEMMRFYYEKVFNIFQEFDKVPRISGDLVVELEDFLDGISKDNIQKMRLCVDLLFSTCFRDRSRSVFCALKDEIIVIPDKGEVMKLVEAWRKYKVEERL